MTWKLICCVFFLFDISITEAVFSSTIPAKPAEAVDTIKPLHAVRPKNHANQKLKSDDLMKNSSKFVLLRFSILSARSDLFDSSYLNVQATFYCPNFYCLCWFQINNHLNQVFSMEPGVHPPPLITLFPLPTFFFSPWFSTAPTPSSKTRSKMAGRRRTHPRTSAKKSSNSFAGSRVTPARPTRQVTRPSKTVPNNRNQWKTGKLSRWPEENLSERK